VGSPFLCFSLYLYGLRSKDLHTGPYGMWSAQYLHRWCSPGAHHTPPLREGVTLCDIISVQLKKYIVFSELEKLKIEIYLQLSNKQLQ
jgi:hypothetical protein